MRAKYTPRTNLAVYARGYFARLGAEVCFRVAELFTVDSKNTLKSASNIATQKQTPSVATSPHSGPVYRNVYRNGVSNRRDTATHLMTCHWQVIFNIHDK